MRRRFVLNDLKRRKQLRFGPVDVTVVLAEEPARRLSGSGAYRKLLRPSARRLYNLMAGRHSAGPAHNGSAKGLAADRPPDPSAFDREARAIIERIVDIEWYHSIDLGHGVVSPGFVDHREQLEHYKLPNSLEGMRCLDVATYDGFWAFEMERRGAAEVVALDIARWSDSDVPAIILDDVIRLGGDRPTGQGFSLAHDVLRSRVRREICSVYQLTPERFGKFDLVFLSDLLLHLRNPQLALERLFSVCQGVAIIADVYNPLLEAYGDLCLTQFNVDIPSETWWTPNTNTLKAMMTVAGFEPVEELSRLVLDARIDEPIHKVVLHGHVPERHSWRDLVEQELHRAPGANEPAGERA